MSLHIGYAQAEITPALDRPVYLAGFGRNRRATAVHDPLTARALALARGETRVIVVAVDLLGLGRMHCRAIESRVRGEAPGVRTVIACTHTHHGPDTIGLWGPDATESGVDVQYMAALSQNLGAAALAALRSLRPATLRSTATTVTGVAQNARDPDIRDEELTCLQFCAPETGDPLATWLIYPCHPEVLWRDNPHITGDYCHFLRAHVEAASGAPCLASVGALGGMMTPAMPGHSFADAEQMGTILGRAALTALAQTPAAPVTRLEHRRHTYRIPMQNPLFETAIAAGLLPNLLDREDAITTEAGLLTLNGTRIFAVPGELLPRLGLAYKERMRASGADNAAVLGLANDELGYILPADEFIYPKDPLEPEDHYEETMSIGPEAGPRLTAALEALLANPGRA